MKKLILGIVIGIVVSVPVAAIAKMIELPWSNNIYNISDVEHGVSGSVSVFDDGDNKCYIVRQNFDTSIGATVNISCVKR